MSTFEIKQRWSGAVLFACELDAEIAGRSYGFRLGFAVKKAYATGANLTRANLTRADLTDADLTGANLTRANLTRANLTRANLTRADLTDADLTDADLTDADLTDADLTDADLTDADLTGANLTRADLTRADLTDANLTDANLTQIRDDLWAVLSAAPLEVDGLRKALADGRVDGSTYQGDCACLVGTIAKVRGVRYDGLGILRPNSSRPIERFFMGIKRGDTPETSTASHFALAWCDEWVTNMRAAFGPKEAA